MNRSALKLLSVALMAVVLVVSCSQNPVGIFASVARERRIIDDRELANDLSVGAMTRVGSRYFMASGLLRWREAADPDLVNGEVSEWSVIDSPGANYITTSVIEFLGKIYASFVSQSGVPSGVYVIDTPAAATPELLSTPVFGSADTAVQSVGKLFVVDDNGTPTLLVAVRTEAEGVEYALYASTNGSSFSLVTGTDGVGASWTDAASDGTGILYINAASVLIDPDGIQDTTLTPQAAGVAPGTTAPGKTGSAAWRGAHYDGSSTLWLSDSSGFLYSSTSFGGTWVRNASAYRYEGDPDQDPIGFTDFATVSNTVSDVTVVGTQALGYYVLGTDASTAPASPAVAGSNYRESDLSSVAVNTFFVDTNLQSDYPVPTAAGDPYELLDGYLLFAGTANGGLWRALFHSDPTQWVQE